MTPDAEALLVEALRAQPSVSTPVGGRIGTRLSGTYPAIRVTLLGGAPNLTTNTAVPDLQVECWGNGNGSDAETQASDLARAVEAAGWSLGGVYTSGKIVGSAVNSYILHSPDPVTGRERYLLVITLVTQ